MDRPLVIDLPEEVDLITPERLRGVQRGVGVMGDPVETKPAAAAAGDADAHRDGKLLTAGKQDRCPADQASELHGDFHSLVDVGLRQDEEELFATVATDRVRCPQVRPQDLRDVAEYDVSGRVAVRVVDALEVIDVRERGTDRPVVASGPLQLGGEPHQGRLAVEDTGQLVGRRDGLDSGQASTESTEDVCELRVPWRAGGGVRPATKQRLGIGDDSGHSRSNDGELPEHASAEDAGNERRGDRAVSGRVNSTTDSPCASRCIEGAARPAAKPVDSKLPSVGPSARPVAGSTRCLRRGARRIIRRGSGLRSF